VERRKKKIPELIRAIWANGTGAWNKKAKKNVSEIPNLQESVMGREGL